VVHRWRRTGISSGCIERERCRLDMCIRCVDRRERRGQGGQSVG
jgi:hypothetical protein